jgi:peptidoglycan/LPS O-acetylase OafA/YrhL
MGIGLIRLLLAESVVMSHSYGFFGYNILNPVIAVEMFFIISGFYMAMILNSKYDEFWLFIKNRILRLYPIYITILSAIIILSVFSFFFSGSWFKLSVFINQFNSFRPASYFFVVFANLSMLFQDLIMFTGLDKTGNLIFSAGPHSAAIIPPQDLLLIPPAWTLGLEWTFYVLAPFIVKKPKALIGLVILSLAVKGLLTATGLTGDPWSYRFFPAELYLFCGGALAFNFYQKYKNRISLQTARITTFLFIGLILVFNFLPLPAIFFYLVFILFLPFIFFYSKNIRFDRRIGELSYPVYLSHLLMLSCLGKIDFFSRLNIDSKFIVLLIVTLSFSWILIKYVQEPIDKIREYNLIEDSFYSQLYLCALFDYDGSKTSALPGAAAS